MHSPSSRCLRRGSCPRARNRAPRARPASSFPGRRGSYGSPVFIGVSYTRKEEARLRGLGSSFWFGNRGKNFRGYREQDYFFLEAFFLPFFFALAMLALHS